MNPSIHPLYQFLLDRFSGFEMRQLAALHCDEIVNDLPGDSASAAELAMRLCAALQRLGMIDQSLFTLLEHKRARFKADIDALRRHFAPTAMVAAGSTDTRLQVVFVAANPIALPELRLAEEAKGIEDKLRGTPAAAQIRFQWSWGAGPDDLLDTLVETSPDVLHFAGHGGSNGALMLETAEGEVHPVQPEALVGLLWARPKRPRMVVLNACYSASMAGALRSCVDVVVGMRGTVGDDAARQFTVQFYRALARRDSLAVAFDTARAALRVHNLLDDHQPQLTVRDSIDPAHYHLL